MSRARSPPPRTASPGKNNRPGSPGIVNFNGAMGGAVDVTKVRLNAKGGILVTDNEITSAFSFLDVEKIGKVSIANLKKRLGPT